MNYKTYRAAKLILFVFVATIIGSSPAFASPFDLLQTFLNPSPDDGDSFGASVAAVGSDVLVGAPGFLGGTDPDGGSAYRFNSATGALLENPTPDVQDNFGVSVAAVGDNVLIGAFRDNTGAVSSGAAYLFDGDTGALLQTFLNPTPAAGDGFGFSVAARGDDVLIGLADGIPDPDGGAAYLFDGDTGALLDTFLNPTPAAGDNFGSSVAAVGNDILIGASGDDTAGTGGGAAYLFNGTTGSLLHTFLGTTGGAFGWSVAALGNDILIGAARDNSSGVDNSGSAFLFEGVPEPSSFALLVLGFVGTLRLRHRGQQRA